jgi:cytochrome oxidase assembly protein ShyY1
VPIALFVVGMSIACVLLARWQWDRLEQRRAANAVVAEGRAQDPVPVEALEASGQGVDWRPVTALGRYDEADQLLVRQRALGGRNGFWVVTPLDLAQGRVWVARGWVPPGPDARTSPDVPAPPPGVVEVQGWARAFEPAIDGSGDLPVGQIRRLSAAELTGSKGSPEVWVQAADESPAPTTALPRLPAPEISEGPHFGYAVQWGAFAIMAVVGGIVIVRRQREYFAEDIEAAGRPSQDGPEPAPHRGEDI